MLSPSFSLFTVQLKAKAIAGTVEGEVTEELPGSALQKHPDVVIIADKEALAC